ncbi:MAG TPA: L-threonylcarbamoyladenylate synthase [Phycisphaerales bacterium]|nr:L-threonylcarbamoyladenylate synthase [Phycisphaerales bacterium]HRQ76690.1 L-threonylcarbamoyladenylate synthase [Phycisphaerales bacterium]
MPRVELPTREALAEAAERLRRGGIVAFPTETVYGLGADTFNEEAIQRVYATKGRPFNNPLIAHVRDAAQAQRLVATWDRRCEILAQRFWPGPLTLVVAKASGVPAAATAGYPTIAVRCPAHQVARELLAAFGGPLSAPSANRSGRISPTQAQHVASDFAACEDLLILDGGPCEVGIESTVVDLSGEKPRILRPGSVSREAIEIALGERVAGDIMHDTQHASPGTAASHYAPQTPAELVSRDDLPARLAESTKTCIVLARGSFVASPPHHVLIMPTEPDDYAHALYATLRAADALGVSRMLIERVPEGDERWAAVRDRLRRATHG